MNASRVVGVFQGDIDLHNNQETNTNMHLGSVAVFVRIRRDGRDTRKTEVETGEREAGLLHKSDNKAAETAVDMETNTAGQREGRQLFDRINCPIRILQHRARRRCVQEVAPEKGQADMTLDHILLCM